MIKKALCIGNAAYPESPLNNPVNDARDLSQKLEALGFSCRLCTDATYRGMDEALNGLSSDLSGAEVGLFFFAGHGLQIDGDNYLTGIDTDGSGEINAKHSSLRLNKVIDVLDRGDNATSIIILDACRTNPFERRWRGGEYLGLAPVYAPKGTIIAYATSPGQPASDGESHNGAFTSAFLTHISTQNLTIEDLFKRVRNTLSAITSGRQTSWEHTSLMGDFFFNLSAPAIGEYVTEYSPQATADSNFQTAIGNPLREIIRGLKSHTWDTQNSAMVGLSTIDLSRCDKDSLFVLGRNIYQAACGTAKRAESYLRGLSDRFLRPSQEIAFHIMNGILYEIYFDSLGRFREKKKTQKIADVFAHENDEYFSDSVQFIQQILIPYNKWLFYLPGSGREIVVNIKVLPENGQKYKVIQIIHENQDILYASDRATLITNWQFPWYQEGWSVEQFEIKLASDMAVPRSRIRIIYSPELRPGNVLSLPYDYRIERLSRSAPYGDNVVRS